MSLRRQGMIRSFLKWTMVFVLGLAIGVGGSLGYRYWKERGKEQEKVIVLEKVLTVNREISMGAVLTPEDIEEMEINEENIPAGALKLTENAVGQKVWVNLKPKVILSEDFFYQKNLEMYENNQEITVREIPASLESGDYIDIRVKFPSGHDYCVLAHKQVGDIHLEEKKMTLSLSEEERLRFSSALTDTETYDLTYLYVSVYPKAKDTPMTEVRYPVNGSVQALYEEIAGRKINGQLRNDLETALEQLKAEQKFLEGTALPEEETSVTEEKPQAANQDEETKPKETEKESPKKEEKEEPRKEETTKEETEGFKQETQEETSATKAQTDDSVKKDIQF